MVIYKHLQVHFINHWMFNYKIILNSGRGKVAIVLFLLFGCVFLFAEFITSELFSSQLTTLRMYLANRVELFILVTGVMLSKRLKENKKRFVIAKLFVTFATGESNIWKDDYCAIYNECG